MCICNRINCFGLCECFCPRRCPPPPPFPPSPFRVGPRGPKGADGKSAYQIAVEHGFVGTEEEWLESLKGKPAPFLSSYMEALGNTQSVDANNRIVFDTVSTDSVGNNIVLDPTGRVFTINKTGLYHVEWNVNLAPGTMSAVVGVIENGAGASGAASSFAGGLASGTLINVTAVPFTLSLYNYANSIEIENPPQWQNTAASIRIVRFADGASV